MKTHTYPERLRFTQFETRRRETLERLGACDIGVRAHGRRWRLRLPGR